MQLCQHGGKTKSGIEFRYDGCQHPTKPKIERSAEEKAAAKRAGHIKTAAAQGKKVRCLTTGELFPSITAAAENIGVCIASVSAAIHRNGTCCKRRLVFEDKSS